VHVRCVSDALLNSVESSLSSLLLKVKCIVVYFCMSMLLSYLLDTL
jgi:hypothetical protein